MNRLVQYVVAAAACLLVAACSREQAAPVAPAADAEPEAVGAVSVTGRRA